MEFDFAIFSLIQNCKKVIIKKMGRIPTKKNDIHLTAWRNVSSQKDGRYGWGFYSNYPNFNEGRSLFGVCFFCNFVRN